MCAQLPKVDGYKAPLFIKFQENLGLLDAHSESWKAPEGAQIITVVGINKKSKFCCAKSLKLSMWNSEEKLIELHAAMPEVKCTDAQIYWAVLL